MPPDPHRCPNCGNRVLPLAAGCSLCGAELDMHRFDKPAGPIDRLFAKVRRLLRRV